MKGGIYTPAEGAWWGKTSGDVTPAAPTGRLLLTAELGWTETAPSNLYSSPLSY